MPPAVFLVFIQCRGTLVGRATLLNRRACNNVHAAIKHRRTKPKILDNLCPVQCRHNCERRKGQIFSNAPRACEINQGRFSWNAWRTRGERRGKRGTNSRKYLSKRCLARTAASMVCMVAAVTTKAKGLFLFPSWRKAPGVSARLAATRKVEWKRCARRPEQTS